MSHWGVICDMGIFQSTVVFWVISRYDAIEAIEKGI